MAGAEHRSSTDGARLATFGTAADVYENTLQLIQEAEAAGFLHRLAEEIAGPLGWLRSSSSVVSLGRS